MNHFIYAMNSADPAPATGGDTKSWFEYYKWNVDGPTYVPVSEEFPLALDPDHRPYLWFVMDGNILGCVLVHSFMQALSGAMEVHYDTRLIQVKTGTEVLTTTEKTGRATDQSLYEALKMRFDQKYPQRDPALAVSFGLVQSKDNGHEEVGTP